MFCVLTEHPTSNSTVDGMRSIAIPGGTRALELSEVVDIFYDSDDANVELRCSTLHGAIIAKSAAAVDIRTAGHQRHIQDVAFLLSVIEDPIDFAAALTDSDLQTLSDVARHIPNMPTAWTHIAPGDRSRAEAALRIILR